MSSRNSTNRKRSRSALSSIVNVHQNNNNKRIKPNQNILGANCKRAQVAYNNSGLQSIEANVHQNYNKRIKLCNESQQVNVNSQLSNCSTVNRALHLHHLPFDCLSSILSRISLQHRITRLSLVCHHWKSTVDEMCTIKGQLTINLFSNYKPRVMQLVTSDLEQYWENVKNEKMESLLLLKPKNENSNPPDLSVRFPLVTQLVIRSNDTTERQNCASLQLFLSLLGQQPQEWCSSLTSLTGSKLSKITDPTFLPQLCSMINHKFRKSNLKQLILYIQAFGPTTSRYHPECVMLHNVLPQLELFFVYCNFQNWTSVVRSLGCGDDHPNGSRTVSGCKVKEIDLSENKIFSEDLSRLLSQTQLTSTVTHLHLTSIRSRAWFSLICESFGLLQFLQINIGNNKFDAEWLSDLRKLIHLTELKMHRFLLDPTTVNIVPVPTVKKLTICEPELLTKFRVATGLNRFNASHYCRLLSHHFPSVSVLILLSNEKSVTMVEKNIRKWAQVHFKQIDKVVFVLKAVEYANHKKWRRKFMREYRKSLRT